MINTVDRVFQLMEQNNLSLYKLCQMSGVNYSTVNTTKRRNGQLNLDTVDRICDALGITMSQFFDVTDEELEEYHGRGN